MRGFFGYINAFTKKICYTNEKKEDIWNKK